MADSATRLEGVSEERQPPAHETNATEITIDPWLGNQAAENSDIDKTDEPSDEGVNFVEKDGQVYAGTHLLVEFWEARNLSDVAGVERALREAAEAAGATVLHSYLHPFGPEMGVSGVVVLAESHISIHTWPERSYAAIDVFMCGDCDPYRTLPVLEATLTPARVTVSEQRRGLVE